MSIADGAKISVDSDAIEGMADRQALDLLLHDAAPSLPLPFALYSSGGQVAFNVYEGDARLGPNVFRAYLVCPVANFDGSSPTPPPTQDSCAWFYYCFDPRAQTVEQAATLFARYVEEKTGRKFPKAG